MQTHCSLFGNRTTLPVEEGIPETRLGIGISLLRRSLQILDRFREYQQFLLKAIDPLSKDRPEVKSIKKETQRHINKIMNEHIESIQKEGVDDLTGKLMLGLLLEIKDMTAISARVVQLHSKAKAKGGIQG